MADIIQLRRGNAATWTSVNPVLADGEEGIEQDTRKFKIGDGTTAWNSLSYWGASGGGGSEITNGAKITALELNTNWGSLGNYGTVMLSNESTVLSGQVEHDYLYGTDSDTATIYKYEIVNISSSLSVIRIPLKTS